MTLPQPKILLDSEIKAYLDVLRPIAHFTFTNLDAKASYDSCQKIFLNLKM
jgi:hypothetical protein